MVKFKNDVIKLYEDYGFKYENIPAENTLVFTIRSGHFYNAEVLVLGSSDNIESEEIFKQLVDSGYACQKKIFNNIEDIKNSLFDGFFSFKYAKDKLRKSYYDHINTISNALPNDKGYKYIKSKYMINDVEGSVGVIEEIKNRLEEENPILFLIEAAAGFGKTCTAYELLKYIIEDKCECLPFFSELAKNRQAKIFKYILLDEIDRNFPNLKYNLVMKEIKSGKVPVILDGFDELIDDKKENSIDNNHINISETMLSTISELLEDKAKIIITTRRTAIFDSLEFNQWIKNNQKKFEIYRIKINEPTINEWLPNDRIKALSQESQSLLKLKNPVLLSYLQSIEDEEFSKVISNPKKIVDRYFATMLEREKGRQDLKMELPEQEKVLEGIAKYLTDIGKTSVKKEQLIEYIAESYVGDLENVIQRYTGDENKPNFDELVNKLANHALLDGLDNKENKNITFVNEFVLGYFLVKNILKDPEWLAEKYFIEPAINATISLDYEEKALMWENIQSSLEINDDENILLAADIILNEKITLDMKNGFVQDMIFENITFGEKLISSYGFENCTFNSCTFLFKNINILTLSNCKLYSCEYSGELKNIYEYKCISNEDDKLLSDIKKLKSLEEVDFDKNEFDEIDIFILEKFWPMGRRSAHLHRHNNVFMRTTKYTKEQLSNSFEKLKMKNILLVPNKEDFSALNYENIGLIRSILGRI